MSMDGEKNLEELTLSYSIEPTPEPEIAPAPAVDPMSWRLIAARSRVDSFSQEDLTKMVREAREAGQKRIAIDLRANRFLSFHSIRFCVDLAQQLVTEGGRLALVGCPEKTKRHFEIYGSLKNIDLVRSERELKQAPAEATQAPPPTESPEL